MSEYGSDWDNGEDFYETNKERDEDKNEEIKSEEINEDRDPYKETEDPLEEYNYFDPIKETVDPFEEYNDFDPNEETEDPFEEYNNFNPNEEIEDPFVEYEDFDPDEDTEDPFTEYKDWSPEQEFKNETSEGVYQEDMSEFKKIDTEQEIKNGNKSTIKNFNEYLRENLYKNKQLGLSEKSKIIKLTQNESLTEEEMKELELILNKFSTEELERYKNKYNKDLSMFVDENDGNLDNLKDFKDDIEDNDIDKKFLEGIDDNLDDHEIEKDFVEGIEDKLCRKYDMNKDFLEAIDEEHYDYDIDKDYIKYVEDTINQYNNDQDFTKGFEEVDKHDINNKFIKGREKEDFEIIEEREILYDKEKDYLESIDKENLVDYFFQKDIELRKNEFDNVDEDIKIQVKPSQKIKVKEIDENVIIKSFPKKSRNIICEEMYRNLDENKSISNSKIVDTLIKDLKDNKSHQKWINKLPADELKELRNKLAKNNINNEFEGSLLKYFHELTNLVKDIKNLNKQNQHINFSELSRNLIKQRRGLNLTKRGLEEAISGVYNHFKNIFDDFNLERAKRKAKLGTESEKESIRCLRKEYKLLNEMYDGLYGGKCSNPNCHTDFKRLPAFDLHHEDSKIKTTIWTEIMHKKYDEIKNNLESQKVKPICKNCHLSDNAKIFNDFKDTILKKDLFTYSSNDIDKIINLKIDKFIKENNTNYTAASLKYEVKRWIKKRSVIEQVFNGKCISCGEYRLPSLQTHHTNQDLKVHKWGNISRKWNIKELINEFIIEEECVCLCGNCHAMINTKNFENNIEEILGEKYLQEVKADYNKINSAIIKHTDRIKKIKKGIIKLIVKDHLNEN